MPSMEALGLNKSQCLSTYLDESGKPYDKLVVGAIIFKQTTKTVPNILLLKRAAHEKHYPDIFEIPGGKIEDSDPTVLDAVKREIFEETGLEVFEVIGSAKPFSYILEKRFVENSAEVSSVWRSSLQMNFVCEVVAGTIFRVDPNEHSEGRFVGRGEPVALEVTEQMRLVVEDAFSWLEERG